MEQKDKIVLFEDKVVCPRCHGNGLVYKAMLYPLEKEMLICDECEATWHCDQIPSIKTFQILILFLKESGTSYEDFFMGDEDFYWYKKDQEKKIFN